ncbi:MAG: dynamin family protein, partial [Streptococcaceae bacterium]|nr:dynamin family protein [Streptococcaceae bacterium]
MKKVSIKYNPYKLETQILVDGKMLKENSTILDETFDGSRLQDWIEVLPDLLVAELSDREFEISFHGTTLDYEDLVGVFKEANNQDKAQFLIKEHIRAKETSDKEGQIDDIFKRIQNGPINELRDEEIKNAFQHAKSSDFEVCVVATMSSGKSTLINAMIGSKLMPSRQEACTAIITYIKDVTDKNVPFQAEVYDKDGNRLESSDILTLSTMERLNSDENVSEIKIRGNIPFVTSDDISLVLIDTPGPDNARDPQHKEKQREFLKKSSKALVLYIMEGTYGKDSDDDLLNRVASSMENKGKQSKDRFIFVVNKLDGRRKEDGETIQTLEGVRSYLKRHGISKPNLFPAAALPALDLRMMMNGDIDPDTIDETKVMMKKLNRNSDLHFETYATLPPSVRGEINGMLDEARHNFDGQINENPKEALIHSGVVSIEAAIRQYVQKYAKTAKIKNIVDTFMHKLDEIGAFELTKQELAKNREESDKIVKQIDSIRKKTDSAEEAKKFKKVVDSSVDKVNDDSKKVIERITQKFQA